MNEFCLWMGKKKMNMEKVKKAAFAFFLAMF